MKKQLISVAIAVFSVVGLMNGGTAIAAGKDRDAVRTVTDEFYFALNVMFTGELGPMKKVWSHKDDVTYMGPGGGFRVGWKQVLADWESQAALKLGGKVEPKDMRITVGRHLAIVSNYEIGQNVAADGKPQKVTIRATNLFRKEDGKWKMIGHHTDILPSLQKNQ
jgi:ketosteroid isomerase-like protein